MTLTCYSCGEEGHFASNCPARATKRCAVCGGFDHDATSCVTCFSYGDECGRCGGRGHTASNCPNSYKKASKRSRDEQDGDSPSDSREETPTRSRSTVKRYKTKSGVYSIEREYV